ncbi:CDP-alcohol phosphatidyltransferase family protein [Brachybacterium sp. EF45031]|uniref:CDP-alcohol phosphatidyltransferase family protein n=1 Tax=Brachybacterium sillae TaxID=2810536 RepID=UPI00217DF795|nr:CDP-alcohol phosphatidyltransferase family protein [Brachybacterium sillae]MCS6712425.1 CDP-alcohol phosphatidyltransferase family protein [Brachybacterium sillae]
MRSPQSHPDPGHDRGWATIPNAVTVLRLLLLVPVGVQLVQGGPDPLAVALLLVWALTDWVDGVLARALDQRSSVGETLDPIADRIGLVGIVLSLALAGLVPWTALGVVVAADLVVALLATGAARRGRLGVSWMGKIRTAVLMTSVFLLAAAAALAPGLLPWATTLLWIGVALHLVAGAGYVVRALRANREDRAGRSAPAAP